MLLCHAPQITLSADHYLYVAPHGGAAFARRSAVPAADVRAGHLVWRRTGSGSLAVEAVTSVQPVTEEGLINPFTVRGGACVQLQLRLLEASCMFSCFACSVSHLVEQLAMYRHASAKALRALSHSAVQQQLQLVPQHTQEVQQ